MINFSYIKGYRHYLCLFSFLLLSCLFSLEGAPARTHRIGYGDDNNIFIRQMLDYMEDLRREVNNHETEIRILQEKVNNQDTIVESFRQQVDDTSKGDKNFFKENSDQLEQRINSLEASNKNMAADLRQFKAHANDSAALISQLKQKIESLESSVEAQNQNMENLQVALGSIMEALQIKPKDGLTSSNPSKTYKVKSGDSLEKIAKSNQTTIRILKELNGLKNDRIIVGQTLQMP